MVCSQYELIHYTHCRLLVHTSLSSLERNILLILVRNIFNYTDNQIGQGKILYDASPITNNHTFHIILSSLERNLLLILVRNIFNYTDNQIGQGKTLHDASSYNKQLHFSYKLILTGEKPIIDLRNILLYR